MDNTDVDKKIKVKQTFLITYVRTYVQSVPENNIETIDSSVINNSFMRQFALLNFPLGNGT